MFPTVPTEMAAMAKSQCASQLELWATLNNMALESVTKLIDLNLNIAKQSLVNASATVQQLMHAENGVVPAWTSAHPPQQDVGNVLSYTRQATDVALGMQAELAKLAQESVGEASRKAQEMFQNATKNVPTSEAGATDFMRTAITQINDGYAQWTKAINDNARVIHAAAAPASGTRATKSRT